MRKAVLGKPPWLGSTGALARSTRPAAANAWRVAPSPNAQSPYVSPTAQSVARSVCSTRLSALALSGALPASTSTAVMSCASVSTATAALWPSKRRVALLRPWRISRSCTATSRSGAVPSTMAGPLSRRSTSWHSTRLSRPAASTSAASSELPAGSARRTSRTRSSTRSASATSSARNRARAAGSSQSTAAAPFTLYRPVACAA
jgi:hypothetical protein